jgi:phosphoribosyl-ATP pyrophosphohydrolase
MSEDIQFDMHALEAIIQDRALDDADVSYTARLLSKGTAHIAGKLGEEATETVIAAVSEDDAALTAEAADLLFHLLVLLRARGLSLSDVERELARRTAQSGLAEKASRPKT